MQALGGGGGIVSAAMSTVSKEDHMAISSEDSSSPEHDTAELELGLGLGIGSGGFYKGVGGRNGGGPGNMGHHYPRFLTAKDLASSSSSSASSTSSCSSTLSRANGTAGTKRSAADSVSPSNGGVASNQVVGWPPIRAYRMNSMVGHTKSLATDEFNPMIEGNKNKNIEMQKKVNGNEMNNSTAKIRSSLFVKVNMDGTPIGRKVNLNAHGCYESLAITLEDMFLRHASTVSGVRSSTLERDPRGDPTRRSKLLDGSSDFVLTYEDKDGDWMLVGDVPWGMFLSSVKRLRIMRTSDATGLGKQL